MNRFNMKYSVGRLFRLSLALLLYWTLGVAEGAVPQSVPQSQWALDAGAELILPEKHGVLDQLMAVEFYH
jgi:hypothetical protein